MASESKKLKLSEDGGDVDQNTTKEVSFNETRVKVLKENSAYLTKGKCEGVVYWMARDQRVQDNWALIYAQQLATKHNLPLHVAYCLSPDFPLIRLLVAVISCSPV